MKWLLAFADFCTFPFFFFGKRYFPSPHAPAGSAPADLFFARFHKKGRCTRAHAGQRRHPVSRWWGQMAARRGGVWGLRCEGR